MLEIAACRTVILGDECNDLVAPLTAAVPGLRVVHVDRTSADAGPTTAGGSVARPDDPVYLLFTSGTSGVPKGVSISHRNLCAYLDRAVGRYGIGPGDRCSQAFDLTFDLSAHDLFVTFTTGACLYVPPAASLMSPARFISTNRLTSWFSVPSTAMVLDKLRLLTPDAFPSLRWSLFCGEALPARLADRWQRAASHSTVENLYGPTETTIAVTSYRWNPQTSPLECERGIVPIGWAFDGHRVVVCRDDGTISADGEVGELYVAGPQVTSGYLGDERQTEERFVRLETDGPMFYRTGDLVSADVRGCLHYHGRLDDQVQVRGFRVELTEVDATIRKAAGTDLAMAVAVDLHAGAATRLLAVVEGAENESRRRLVLDECRRGLPDYMAPVDLVFVEKLPVNANGKLDRKGALAVLSR